MGDGAVRTYGRSFLCLVIVRCYPVKLANYRLSASYPATTPTSRARSPQIVDLTSRQA